jgi:hypothetical protein
VRRRRSEPADDLTGGYDSAVGESGFDRLEAAAQIIAVVDRDNIPIHDPAHEGNSAISGREHLLPESRPEVHASMPTQPGALGRVEGADHGGTGRERPPPPGAKPLAVGLRRQGCAADDGQQEQEWEDDPGE